jgi:G:T/U-mismatch repair DNA glycosylase
MKMIFIKSTSEHAYLDVYVRLCDILFKKFQDKENYEMNFKKLLVSKCQKQFFKMLSYERLERKIRKNSMNLEEFDEN